MKNSTPPEPERPPVGFIEEQIAPSNPDGLYARRDVKAAEDNAVVVVQANEQYAAALAARGPYEWTCVHCCKNNRLPAPDGSVPVARHAFEFVCIFCGNGQPVTWIEATL